MNVPYWNYSLKACYIYHALIFSDTDQWVILMVFMGVVFTCLFYAFIYLKHWTCAHVRTVEIGGKSFAG